MSDPRHARQARLRGLGAAGQARIRGAEVDVPLDGLAADVATRYLVGAGVARVRVRATVDPAAVEAAAAIDPRVVVEVAPELAAGVQVAPLGLRDPVAEQVGRGAMLALRAIRDALRDPS